MSFESNEANTARSAAPSTRAKYLQLAALAALILGYAVLSHYSESEPNAKGLGAVLSVTPVALIGVILVWRWTRPLWALLAAILLGVGLYRYWPAVEDNFAWADLVQQCGAYTLVAASFIRSLSAKRVPLCTQIANEMHGPLLPVELDYTRRATLAWALFYALIAASILILFFSVSTRAWSIFVNFATFGLIAVMGIADHAIRYRMLPRRRGRGILTAIQRALVG